MNRFLIMLIALVLFGCQTRSEPLPVAIPPSSTPVPIVVDVTSVPTIAPFISDTPLPTVTPSLTATITDTPTLTLTLSDTPTATLTETPTRIPIVTPTPNPVVLVDDNPTFTWTPPPNDPATVIRDHYHFERPIPDHGVTYAARNYAYGSTNGGTLQVHHGLDFVNPRDTQITAAADGVVVFAGNDNGIMIGSDFVYYGNLVIIEHHFDSPEGDPVYSLYGHLQSLNVEEGAIIRSGDTIGFVGDTGIALGPHLHFEVRVGDPFDFGATRNPDLWIYPYGGFGTLAGRVTDAAGNRLYEVTIQVRSQNFLRNTFSYANDSVNPDPSFDENYTLGDIPANYYEVSVRDSERLRFLQTIYVYPNRTTWLDIQLN